MSGCWSTSPVIVPRACRRSSRPSSSGITGETPAVWPARTRAGRCTALPGASGSRPRSIKSSSSRRASTPGPVSRATGTVAARTLMGRALAPSCTATGTPGCEAYRQWLQRKTWTATPQSPRSTMVASQPVPHRVHRYMHCIMLSFSAGVRGTAASLPQHAAPYRSLSEALMVRAPDATRHAKSRRLAPGAVARSSGCPAATAPRSPRACARSRGHGSGTTVRDRAVTSAWHWRAKPPVPQEKAWLS